MLCTKPIFPTKYCEVEGRNSPILKVLAQAVAFELVIGNNEIKQLSDSELTNMNGIQSCLIEGCDAIEAIVGTSNSVVFPHGSIQQLCEIQCLGIEKCDEIKEIISESDTRGNLPILPKLKKMFLQDMRNQSSICAIETLEWPSLEELEIFNCPCQTAKLVLVDKDGASLEAALDWLYLNLPGNELPLKFSTGTSLYTNEGGAVGIISNSRKDWSPLVDLSAKIEEETPELNVRINLRIFCFKCPESQQ
ncbi:hypothetical protein RHGRI_032181 [Rhododendron griersonianum]|uniref:ATP-dependent RNA helicase DHX29-like UBA domain-containing protein n=1 Tax=Rhododendron griersonianum TaxID=479676 RepID=A0AAV6IAR9_9ERIC|nr:hypothetical protein RHGRI_032181 [Rhododendron griersonianum]